MGSKYLVAVEPESAEANAISGSYDVFSQLSIFLRAEARCAPSQLRSHDDVDQLVNRIESWSRNALGSGSLINHEIEVYVNTGNISTHTVARDGSHPLSAIASRLQRLGTQVIPVTEQSRNNAFDAGFIDAVEICGGRGAFVLNTELLTNPLWKAYVLQKIATSGMTPADMDLIINWGNVSRYTPGVDHFRSTLMRILDLGPWRQVFTMQAACPSSMTGIPEGITNIPRNDWQFGLEMMGIAQDQGVTISFGDYGIGNDITRDLSSFKKRGRPKYIATTPDTYELIRGGKLIPDKLDKQFEGVVTKARASSDYEGDEFYPGNRLLGKIAMGKVKIRENRKLVFASQNRHIVRTAKDLLKLSA